MRKLPRIGWLAMLLVIALAGLGIAWTLWFQELTINSTVQTGRVSAGFVRAFTDDDDVVNDAARDSGDTDECTDFGGVDADGDGLTSCDPAAPGPDPKDRYDKDVARCDATVDPNDSSVAHVQKRNVYPSYYCTAWFDVANDGSIPVKVAGVTIVIAATGEVVEVIPSEVNAFDLDGDGSPDVDIHVSGVGVCQQIDPDGTAQLSIDQHIRQEAPQGAVFAYSVHVVLAQWNEPCPPAGVTPGTDAANRINAVDIAEDGSVGPLSVSEIPAGNFLTEPQDPAPKEDPGEEQPPDRIHPLFADLLAELGPDARVPVIVNLKDDMVMPRFPDLPDGVSRDSDLGAQLMKRQDEIIQGLFGERMESQRPLLETLQGQFGVELMEQYWIINGFLAEVRLGDVGAISEFDEVVFIQPDDLREEPPNHDGNPNNDVIDGRARIVSDPYFNLAGMTGGYIGLMDTGVRATHTLLSAPNDNVDFLRDCVQGGATCNNAGNPGFNTNDDCWNHGTSTAAIIVGNSNLGNDFRGVTDITLDSWKVYPNGCGGLNGTAVLRAYQNGLAVFDRVFVGEMQPSESVNGAIATAADNAFDAGALTIAANGNFGPNSGTVRSPALAHKAIGVGNMHVETLATAASQSRGATSDARYKPDLQAPSNTETARATSDTALGTFTGTSGATPYASGAAALMRNWLKKFGTFDPGQSYSRLIVSGQRAWCCYDNEEGAGDLQMPVCGTARWGKVTVNATGSTINIPIGVGAGKVDLEAALWWPEGAGEAHDDIDLYLIDPSGTERARGYSGPSVFERASVSGPLASGTWTLRVKGFFVSSGPQTVYWTADVHGC